MRMIYTLKDVVEDQCGPLNVWNTDAAAWRSFELMVSREKVPARDFQVLCLGSIDMRTGAIESLVPPRIVNPGLGLEEDEVNARAI